MRQTDKASDFQPVTDSSEARSLLSEGCKTLASVMIWTQEQKHVLNSHLVEINEAERSILVETPREFKLEQFIDDFAKAGSRSCFFSLSLARANVFFKTDYIDSLKRDLRFKLPTTLYKVQRRTNVRFHVPESMTLKVQYQDPLFSELTLSRRVLDLSSGGMAILLEYAEEAIYKSLPTLKDVSFTLRNRMINCTADIRHMKALPTDSRTPGVKAGIFFNGLKESDKNWIAAYVFEESRRALTKFL